VRSITKQSQLNYFNYVTNPVIEQILWLMFTLLEKHKLIISVEVHRIVYVCFCTPSVILQLIPWVNIDKKSRTLVRFAHLFGGSHLFYLLWLNIFYWSLWIKSIQQVFKIFKVSEIDYWKKLKSISCIIWRILMKYIHKNVRKKLLIVSI